MTEPIGVTPPKAPLILPTGGDFVWSFQWKDGNYPAGSELTFLVGNDEDEWPFVIDEDMATIKIEAEVADLIPDGAPHKLRYRDTATTPATDSILLIGQVKRVEPRRK